MPSNTEDLQECVEQTSRGRVVTMDSAYHVGPQNQGVDVVINASYCGVLPARFIARHRPRASISVDCGVGPQGAGIAGLWYLEALNIPAAVADVMTVILGDGRDLYQHGLITIANRPAADCGVVPGMPVRQAALLLLESDPGDPAAEEVTNRVIVAEHPSGRQVVCLDSIAFGGPQDVHNVLVTGGHTGRSSVPYLAKVRPHGFICSDGGMGRDASGTAGLEPAADLGLAGATVSAHSARMGDGMSSYADGVISAVNRLAREAGVAVGMPCEQAAQLLLGREPMPASP
jgi:hypothetical protein